jgi:probable F420-dependent oxidoreductase
MRIGFAVPSSGSWATPPNVRRVAQRAEALGYDSLWTFQRLLYPAADAGPRWQPAYRSVDDPLVLLGFLAAITERVRLGVATVCMPFYSPILLAKQLTTIDRLSGGRLDAGMGIGWSMQEYAAVGTPYERRGARAEEFVRSLLAIWTDDVVSLDGDFFAMPASRVDPKPLQRPHPPLLLGGAVPAALRRAGRLADGWVSASRADLSKIAESAGIVRAAADDAGRDASAVRVVCRGSVKIRPPGEHGQGSDASAGRRVGAQPATGRADPERVPLTGSVDEVRSDLDALAAAGVDEVFVDLNFDPQVGTPDADPAASMRRAEAALVAFAPGS